MNELQLPQPLSGKKIYFVGIKGTGMAALAELFLNAGALVSGSDTDEVFYTDAILKQLGIKYREGFSSTNLEDDYDLVIHSSAYSRDSNPDLEESYKRNIPVMEYTKALGAWSRTAPSCGIAGVHGKTTTTGITGTILKEMGLPVSVLAGSAISNFDGKSTFTAGDKYFVAETCEYKRHFLSFSPDILLVTSIEPDHLDYFKDYDDIFSAFLSYADKLPDGGILIYCSDEKGAASLGKAVGEKNKRIKLIPYGISADGDFKVKNIKQLDGKTSFALQGIESDFELRVPGLHNVLNSAAAAAVSACVASFINRKKISDVLKADGKKIASGVRNFKGSKRRSELLGEACGIVFMDDYGHHPTAIEATLSGLRSFYPGKRIIVDFMSHTYSRTKALLDDFASSFSDADVVILNKIYSSAREKSEGENSIDNEFFIKAKKNHGNVFFYKEPSDAAGFLKNELRKGDLFLTMGAGDNWKLGQTLYTFFKRKESDKGNK